jgi:hypothetical protein
MLGFHLDLLEQVEVQELIGKMILVPLMKMTAMALPVLVHLPVLCLYLKRRRCLLA